MTYTPSTILLTGGAGFIGSHVAEMLATKYPHYKVIVLDKMDYCASLQNLKSLKDNDNFEFVKGDIQSMDLVAHLLLAKEVDTVMHFAAQTHVDNSFGNSLAFTMNNTHGTHVLLEACRKVGLVRRFVNVSTDEVYGDTSADLAAGQGIGEGSSLEPTNPYSAAKAGAEMLCKAYATSYKLPIIITRGNNVYGPRQYPEKLIPKFLLLASAGLPLPIHGDGSSIRSYLYIDDVVDAFDKILHGGVAGETYNIGTEEERTVLSVAEDIRAILKSDVPLESVRDRAFNDKRYYIGTDKLRGKLQWSQRVSWAEGLARTAAFYADVDENYWSPAEVKVALEAHPFVPFGVPFGVAPPSPRRHHETV